MGEKRHGFFERLFSSSHDSGREKRVLEYIIHRIGDGAHLRDVMKEEYVRRNASPDEVEQILENPKLVEAAHEQMRDDFTSGELDPKRPPSSAR